MKRIIFVLVVMLIFTTSVFASFEIKGDREIKSKNSNFDNKINFNTESLEFNNKYVPWSSNILFSPNLQNEFFGNSIALENDRLYIGATWNSDLALKTGAVYVFENNGNNYEHVLTIYPPESIENILFGNSLFVNDDYLIIGASYEKINNLNYAGAVYIYEKENNDYVFKQKITQPYQANLYLGISNLIIGDYLFVSANNDNTGSISRGAVFVYKKEGDLWIEQQKLMPTVTNPNLNFGYRIKKHTEDRVFIGAAGETNNNGLYAGSLYEFKLEHNQWIFDNKIIPEIGGSGAAFADNFCFKNEKLYVSEIYDENFGGSGAVHLFVKENDLWVQKNSIYPPETTYSFGSGIACGEDYLFVGDQFENNFGYNIGSIYIYEIDGEEIKFERKIVNSKASNNDRMGFILETKGNTLYSGVPGFDHSNQINSGAVFIFKKSDFMNIGFEIINE